MHIIRGLQPYFTVFFGKNPDFARREWPPGLLPYYFRMNAIAKLQYAPPNAMTATFNTAIHD